MKNVILVTLLASTLGLGAAAVHANNTTAAPEAESHMEHKGGKHKGKRGGRQGMMKRMVEELGLTAEQQEKIKALRNGKKGAKGKKDKAARQAARAEFEAILTPEQLVKFKAHRKGKRGGKQGKKAAE